MLAGLVEEAEELDAVGDAEALELTLGDGLVAAASAQLKALDFVEAVPDGRGLSTLTTVKVGEHSGVEVLPSGALTWTR